MVCVISTCFVSPYTFLFWALMRNFKRVNRELRPIEFHRNFTRFGLALRNVDHLIRPNLRANLLRLLVQRVPPASFFTQRINPPVSTGMGSSAMAWFAVYPAAIISRIRGKTISNSAAETARLAFVTVANSGGTGGGNRNGGRLAGGEKKSGRRASIRGIIPEPARLYNRLFADEKGRTLRYHSGILVKLYTE
jgi:hypothetical protein